MEQAIRMLNDVVREAGAIILAGIVLGAWRWGKKNLELLKSIDSGIRKIHELDLAHRQHLIDDAAKHSEFEIRLDNLEEMLPPRLPTVLQGGRQ